MLAGKAESYAGRVDALVERLEDPLKYASELQRRFPPQHRPLLLPAPGTY
jgi:hypothetical protein